MARSAVDALEWLLGEEGSVAAEVDVQVVMAATGTAITGIYLLSPIISTLAGPFSVSGAAAGQLVTAFTLPPILLVPVFGVLADRYGPRPVLTFGLAAFGVGGGAIALAPNFEVALVLRGLQGVGYAAINPVGVALIGDAYTGSREATAQGLRVVSIQAASLLVPPVAGALVLLGWQVPFLLYLLAIPAAVWAWRALPADRGGPATSLRSYASDLRSSLASTALGAVVLSFVARYALSFAFVAYVSVRLDDLGASAVEVGVLLSLVGLCSLVASTQAGRVTAALDLPLVVLAGFLGTAVGMILMGIAGAIPLVVVGIVFYGATTGLSGPVQKSLVTQLSPPEVRAGTVSSALTFQSIGSAVGPFLMGIALQYVDAGTAFVLFGGVLGGLGAALLLVAFLADRPAGQAEPRTGGT